MKNWEKEIENPSLSSSSLFLSQSASLSLSLSLSLSVHPHSLSLSYLEILFNLEKEKIICNLPHPSDVSKIIKRFPTGFNSDIFLSLFEKAFYKEYYQARYVTIQNGAGWLSTSIEVEKTGSPLNLNYPFFFRRIMNERKQNYFFWLNYSKILIAVSFRSASILRFII